MRWLHTTTACHAHQTCTHVLRPGPCPVALILAKVPSHPACVPVLHLRRAASIIVVAFRVCLGPGRRLQARRGRGEARGRRRRQERRVQRPRARVAAAPQLLAAPVLRAAARRARRGRRRRRWTGRPRRRRRASPWWQRGLGSRIWTCSPHATISLRVTGSHPNSEVKLGRARVVRRWGTTSKGRVLHVFFPLLPPFFPARQPSVQRIDLHPLPAGACQVAPEARSRDQPRLAPRPPRATRAHGAPAATAARAPRAATRAGSPTPTAPA